MRSKGRSTARPHYYGAADGNPLVAWRFAPHNHADQADIGRQSFRFFRPRGLSAAPLGILGNASAFKRLQLWRVNYCEKDSLVGFYSVNSRLWSRSLSDGCAKWSRRND